MIIVALNNLTLHFFHFWNCRQWIAAKKTLTPQRILALQEQLLGFINEHVIPESGKYHVSKWDVDPTIHSLTPSSSSVPNSHSRKKRSSNSSVNKWVSTTLMFVWTSQNPSLLFMWDMSDNLDFIWPICNIILWMLCWLYLDLYVGQWPICDIRTCMLSNGW